MCLSYVSGREQSTPLADSARRRYAFVRYSSVRFHIQQALPKQRASSIRRAAFGYSRSLQARIVMGSGYIERPRL